MISRKSVGRTLLIFAGITLTATSMLLGQGDDAPRRGRKYKAPPPISHIEVTVRRASNGKPLVNVAVVFHELNENGKDQGNLEVKTDTDGKAIIDVIPIGSDIRVQVIANGYATFGEEYHVDGPASQIAINMVTPREQVSVYRDSNGKQSQLKPGVQEPLRPPPPPPANAPLAPQ